ncbi:hypothetical protein HPB50_011312 [Hyalomma asiaticum]|uniref:Uncharacterized protein n=1 Tax=Hyalomma asiaticum TaxID=266040 RepID=A0ACB7RUI8_HYAAI|nr:hypothetical protein HPB50_011312 [Hyalomma asiaticum]
MSSQLSKSTKENKHAGPMYYAYVRFVDDGKRHILPIRDIQNFKPSNLKNFKPRKVYNAKWKDDVQDDFFGAQIVKLFGTYEEAQEETSRERLPVPPAEASSSSSDDSEPNDDIHHHHQYVMGTQLIRIISVVGSSSIFCITALFISFLRQVACRAIVETCLITGRQFHRGCVSRRGAASLTLGVLGRSNSVAPESR